MSNARHYFSIEIILDEKIKDAKMKSFSSDFKHSLNIIILYELLITLRTHFEYEELSKRKSNEKHFEFMWKSSAIGLSPLLGM